MPSDRPSGGAAASAFSKLLALGAEGRAARRSVYLNHGFERAGCVYGHAKYRAFTS
jgi:hypothetical protein